MAARRGRRWRGRCAAGCTPPGGAPARPGGSRTGLQKEKYEWFSHRIDYLIPILHRDVK